MFVQYRVILFFFKNQLAIPLDSFNELRDFRILQLCKRREIGLSRGTSSNLPNEKQIRPTRLPIIDEGWL